MPIELHQGDGDRLRTRPVGGKPVETGRRTVAPELLGLVLPQAMAIFAMPLVLVLLMLAQIGCAPVIDQPSASTGIAVPTGWSASDSTVATGSSSLGQWWLRFDDPLLGSLVNRAMQANTSVKGAQAALRQAARCAMSRRPPCCRRSAARHRHNAARPGATAPSTVCVGLDASWEPDLFGGNRSALASRGGDPGQCGKPGRRARVDRRRGGARLHRAARRPGAAGDRQDNLETQLETLQITEWRLQAGLVTSLDAEQARGSRADPRPAARVADRIEQARHALAVLTGQPPAALSTLLAAAGPVPQAADDLALSFPAETLRQRPDVRAAEYQVTAAVGRVRRPMRRGAGLPARRFAGPVL